MKKEANTARKWREVTVPYAEALEIQRALVAARREGRTGDGLWLLEHPPTLTWGRTGGRKHLLFPEEELRREGYAVVPTDRGGDVTCHEPGQLVGYPIVYLGAREEDKDLLAYLRRLEQGLLALLSDYGVEGHTIPGRTGIWIPGTPPRKIAAIGVRCAGWTTSHGFALNVVNDLIGFEKIVPCGIRDAGVTSLALELGGAEIEREELLARAHRRLEEALDRSLALWLDREPLALLSPPR